MNAVIMDNVDLGDECIVGALTFIKTDEKIPARSLVVGNPSKIIKQVSDEMIRWKLKGQNCISNYLKRCMTHGNNVSL